MFLNPFEMHPSDNPSPYVPFNFILGAQGEAHLSRSAHIGNASQKVQPTCTMPSVLRSILFISLTVFLYGLAHSVLASLRAKALSRQWVGKAALLRDYGDDYARYQTRTPMLVPRVKNKIEE